METLVKPRMLESLAKVSNILHKSCATLEIDLVSLKATGGKKSSATSHKQYYQLYILLYFH